MKRYAIILALLASPLHAADAPKPEKLEPIPEPSASAVATAEPEVTVKKRGNERIEEFRLKGRLYMIKVYPAVGPAYTLIDDQGNGVFNRTDGRRTPGVPARWDVLSW